MLRGNLSTRPFYNERLVALGLALVGIVAVALMVFNVRELMASSAARSELQARIADVDKRAESITAEANGVRRVVDQLTLRQLGADTHEANTLIDQRTFSWVTLLGVLERTLPYDVRLLSVTPRFDRGNTRLTMQLVTKDIPNLQRFERALWDAGGTFYSISTTSKQLNDDNTYNVIVEAFYLAPTPSPTQSKATQKRGGE